MWIKKILYKKRCRILWPFRTNVIMHIKKYYDITIQNWPCVCITVIGSIIHRACCVNSYAVGAVCASSPFL